MVFIFGLNQGRLLLKYIEIDGHTLEFRSLISNFRCFEIYCIWCKRQKYLSTSTKRAIGSIYKSNKNTCTCWQVNYLTHTFVFLEKCFEKFKSLPILCNNRLKFTVSNSHQSLWTLYYRVYSIDYATCSMLNIWLTSFFLQKKKN